jgi:charged multivesicular body protein 2A
VQAMRIMNKRLNMPQLQKIMREFEMQNEKMEMTGEMMGDAIDDAMGVSVQLSNISKILELW